MNLMYLTKPNGSIFAAYEISQIVGVEMRETKVTTGRKFLFFKKTQPYYIISIILKNGLEQDVHSSTDLETAISRRNTIIQYMKEEGGGGSHQTNK